MTFDEWIRSLIEQEYGGSNAAFARACGITANVARCYKLGLTTPTVETYKKIVKGLGKSPPQDAMEDFIRRNRIIQQNKLHCWKNDTICWDCQNAVPSQTTGCSWSRYRVPVTGWEAIPSKLISGAFMVLECPEFKRDEIITEVFIEDDN